jgi:hypothetical protein
MWRAVDLYLGTTANILNTHKKEMLTIFLYCVFGLQL